MVALVKEINIMPIITAIQTNFVGDLTEKRKLVNSIAEVNSIMLMYVTMGSSVAIVNNTIKSKQYSFEVSEIVKMHFTLNVHYVGLF